MRNPIRAIRDYNESLTETEAFKEPLMLVLYKMGGKARLDMLLARVSDYMELSENDLKRSVWRGTGGCVYYTRAERAANGLRISGEMQRKHMSRGADLFELTGRGRVHVRARLKEVRGLWNIEM